MFCLLPFAFDPFTLMLMTRAIIHVNGNQELEPIVIILIIINYC